MAEDTKNWYKVAEAIANSEPFRVGSAHSELVDGIYYIYHKDRLVYRLNCVTRAYSIDHSPHGGERIKIINLIKKAKKINATPFERALARDTESS